MDEWTSKDATRLQRFLRSDTGQKLVEKFKALEPPMDAETFEGQALQASEFKQFRKTKNVIKACLGTQPESKPQTEFIDVGGLDVKE